MAKKPCQAQFETSDGQTYSCDKDRHLSPVHTDGGVRVYSVPGLPALGVLIRIPRP
jgi:hypothetical protein